MATDTGDQEVFISGDSVEGGKPMIIKPSKEANEEGNIIQQVISEEEVLQEGQFSKKED